MGGERAMTLTWGWALYVVVPFLLFVAGVVVILLPAFRRFELRGSGKTSPKRM